MIRFPQNYAFLVVSHDSIRGCVHPLVRLSVGPLVMLLSVGRDKPANDLLCVYELVFGQGGM